MNGPIAPYILPAIQRLAETYPNALYYPMQISCEIYELRKNALPKDICDAIERIMHMIKSPILEEFSNELKRLTDPYHIVKDFLAYIRVSPDSGFKRYQRELTYPSIVEWFGQQGRSPIICRVQIQWILSTCIEQLQRTIRYHPQETSR